MINFKIAIIFACLILFYPISSAFAREEAFLTEAELQSFGFTKYEQVNPNLLIYPLKRVSEQVRLTFLPNHLKKEYAYQLLDVRFKELVFIINSKKEGFIVYTVDRYNAFIGKIKLDYPPYSADQVKIESYLKMLERLRDIYPANSGHWVEIQQATDTTKSLL